MGWIGDRLARAIAERFTAATSKKRRRAEESTSMKCFKALAAIGALEVEPGNRLHLLVANTQDAVNYIFESRGILVHSFSRAETELRQFLPECVGIDSFDPVAWAELPYIVRSAAALALAEALESNGEVRCQIGDHVLKFALAHCQYPKKVLAVWPQTRDPAQVAAELEALIESSFNYMNSAYLRMRPTAYLSWYSTAPEVVQRRFPAKVPHAHAQAHAARRSA